MKIIYKQISELIPYINNPRKNDKAVDSVASSIKNFGFKVPIIIDSQGEIIAGHTRLKAAKKLDIKEVPCLIANDLTPAQIKAFRIADNKVSESAEWDIDLLKIEIQDLDEFTGFELEELNIMFEEEKEIIEDEVPEIQKEVITKLGDLYEIGEHRLLCGDSTDIEQVAKLMNGQKSDMVFTSPPYNANTKAGQGDIFNKKKSVKLYSDGYSDNLKSSDYVNFTSLVLNNCFLFTEGHIFWNVSYNANSRFEYIQQIQNHIQYLIEQICWKKSSTIPFKGSMMRDWEPIYVFSTNGSTLGLNSVHSNHWEINNTNSQQDNHKACFPVELPSKAITLNESYKLIIEPFLGSGSTMVACHQLNRKCYGMELDPKYCDVIIRRMINLDPHITIKRNGIDCKQEFTK